jgi:integrase
MLRPDDVKAAIASGANKKLADGRGLYLVIRRGRGYWVYQFRDDSHVGRQGQKQPFRSIGLGSAVPPGGVSPKQARDKRDEYAVARRNGTLPRTNGHQAPSIHMAGAPVQTLPGATFRAAAESFLGRYAGSVSEKEASRARYLIETHTDPIAVMSVTSITADHVASVLEPIWTGRGSNRGSRLRLLIERILDSNDIAPNPASWKRQKNRLLAKASKSKRLAAVPWAEAPEVFAAIDGDDNLTRALKFAILTAARISMVLEARWSEIDFDKRVWNVPAEHMKMDEAHGVPLSDAALALLGPKGADDALIFPGARGGEIHPSMPLEAFREMTGRSETVHGFRSSFTDWAAEAGYPSELRELALAHQVGDEVERAYRRTGLVEPRRPMMAAWAAYLTSTRQV